MQYECIGAFSAHRLCLNVDVADLLLCGPTDDRCEAFFERMTLAELADFGRHWCNELLVVLRICFGAAMSRW